ncbi:MAG: serine/threonine-protein kinase [Gemmatimonas sp.]
MTRPDLNQTRWELLERLYWESLERSPQERAEYFAASGAAPDVVDEVNAMLSASEAGSAMRVERRFVSDEGPLLEGLAPGTLVGPYRLTELVGRGGMGEVYRARRADGELDLEVAVKLLRADARSDTLARRFIAERALLARLSHPNIASILDAGTSPDGRPYLVLRYVDGEPVTQYAARLDLTARLRLFLKVADAVQFAHTNLIIHRDLKPSNILVTNTGEPILLDFGIAKLMDDTGETVESERLLTPSHAAPEQLRGEPVTTATDVYGLGALLFEILAGTHPFATRTRSRSEMERDILDAPAPLTSAVATDGAMRARLRGDLDGIVQMALRKEPARRYSTAGQLAGDVQRYLAGLPVLARPDRWSYRAGRFVKRNRVAVTAAITLVLAMGVVLSREVVQSRRLLAERDRAVAEREAGEDVLAFVTDLFEQSDPRVVPGADTLRVGPFLTRAEARVAELKDQSERQMRLYRSLGNVRFSRGDYAVAESLLTLSVELGQKALGAEHLEVLRTRQNLADVRVDRHGPNAATAERDSVLRVLLRTVGRDHPDVSNAYARLSAVTTDADRARALLDTSIALQARSGRVDSVEIASMLDARAREHGTRAQPVQAAALEEAALRIVATRFPAQHATVLTVKGNLATWLNAAGQWERALSLAREVLDAATHLTTPGHALALAYERVALIVVNMPGRLALADSMSRAALRTMRGAVAPEHPLISSSMRNVAIIVAHQGRNADGLALLDSAIARARVSGDTSFWRYMTGQRVPMLIALGRNDEAVRSASFAREARAGLAQGSDRMALIDWHSGMAAMASGGADEATRLFSQVIEVDSRAERMTLSWWRLMMARCALGAALTQSGRVIEGRAQVEASCPALELWGRADSTVVAWGRRAGTGR